MCRKTVFDERRVPDLAQSDPHGVAARADEALEYSLEPRERAVVLWARGLARRELDELVEAERDLREAQALTSTPDDPLSRRIVTSLALVVLYRGNAAEAEAMLSVADDLPPGDERALVLLQRGVVRHRTGDLAGAKRDYEAAVQQFTDERDLSLTRALLNLGVLDVQTGDPRSGLQRFRRARELAQQGSHGLAVANAEQNIGFAHAHLGELSDALASYDRAIERFRELGPTDTRIAVVEADRAEALVSAYLLEEADRSSSAAVDLFRNSDHVIDAGEVALLAARVRLARGELDRARAAAALARQAMEASGRSSWVPLVDAVDVRIDALDRSTSPRDVARRGAAIADRLDELQWRSEGQRLRTLAVRTFIEAGEPDAARRTWASMRRRRVASPLDRAARNYCAALLADAAGDRAAARRAVTRGLGDLAAGRLAASSFEVRAHVLGHLAELAELGLRWSIERGDARGFVRCIERSRAMLLAGGAMAQDETAAAGAAQAALRDLSQRANDPTLDPSGRAQLDAERRRLEQEIARRAQGETGDGAVTSDMARLFDATGEASLLEYAEVDGQLWLATVVGRRASLHRLGRIDAVREPIEHLRFGIARLQRRQGSTASIAAAAELVARGGTELGQLLIPADVGRRIVTADAPVVVVPARSLAAVPWGCLLAEPALPVSVAASGLSWLHASDATGAPSGAVSSQRRVAIACGPDLEHAAAEASAVAACYPSSPVGAPARSVERLLAELPSADVAHLACHGSFRTDNPLFSSLRLDDGDLSFYDLRRCRSMPSAIVLSACDVGQSMGLEGGAFLGLSTALLQLGVHSVIAPMTAVSDERSIVFMAELHTLLAAGAPASVALTQVSRDESGGIRPIAAPFVCFGA